MECHQFFFFKFFFRFVCQQLEVNAGYSVACTRKLRRLSSNSVAKVIPKFENKKLTQIFDFNIPHNVIQVGPPLCLTCVFAIQSSPWAKINEEENWSYTAAHSKPYTITMAAMNFVRLLFFAILEELEHAKYSVRRHSADSTAVAIAHVCAGAGFMCQQLQFNFKIIFVCLQLSRHRRRQPVYGQFGIVQLSFTQILYLFSFTRVLGLHSVHTFCHVNGVYEYMHCAMCIRS